jgi:nitroimidazol reductase NimA-like FMN-containing flavoprotein (pyridoxamine 5'-phosphate oxidase superfamily)
VQRKPGEDRPARDSAFQAEGENMLDKMKKLLGESSICVLATCSENKPLCSLMTYVTDEQADTVYTVTLKTSRKYKNITQNPHVSLLVDSRADDRGDAGNIEALTAFGVSSIVRNKADKDAILTRIGRNNPHLRELLAHPDAEVIFIRVESFLLLEGPTQAHFVDVGKRSGCIT